MLLQRAVQGLADSVLIDTLCSLVKDQRVGMVRLLVHLGEVQERGLFRELGFGSMYTYCVGELGMSGDEAWTRIRAARVGRVFPRALEMMERGELHLTGLRLIGPHLDERNHAALLGQVKGKSKREIEVLVAAVAPQADVESKIRKVPAPLGPGRFKVEFTVNEAMRIKLERLQELSRHRVPNGDLGVILEDAVDLLIAKREQQQFGKGTALRAKASQGPGSRADAGQGARAVDARDGLGSRTDPRQGARAAHAREGSASRTDVRHGARAVDAGEGSGSGTDVRHGARAADAREGLGSRIDVRHGARAVDARDGLGSRYIPRQVRREVAARDEERCTFVSDAGRRCGERAFLQFHHETAFACGGGSSADNLRLVCRAHNQWFAENDFGRAFMRSKRGGAGTGLSSSLNPAHTEVSAMGEGFSPNADDRCVRAPPEALAECAGGRARAS